MRTTRFFWRATCKPPVLYRLLLLSGLAACTAKLAGLPQLGQAPLKEVLAALTPEEKVKLVVGMGFYPSGFPEGMLPPGNPGDRGVPQRVPG
ncbi:MAG: hypothetical protein EOO63_10905, partial [Hymenobacter sp.]